MDSVSELFRGRPSGNGQIMTRRRLPFTLAKVNTYTRLNDSYRRAVSGERERGDHLERKLSPFLTFPLVVDSVAGNPCSAKSLAKATCIVSQNKAPPKGNLNLLCFWFLNTDGQIKII